MPDQSDVEVALAEEIAAALYPGGTAEPSALGPEFRIYRGWPQPQLLSADLAAGRINVTVQPVSGSARNTTRFPDEWRANPATPTLTAAVQNATVTFAGNAAPGQLAGLLIDGASYVHRTRPGDTPGLVAASLAASVRQARPAQLAGSSITITGAGHLLARTVADSPATRELRRQEVTFRITAWCPTPELRDQVSAFIDVAFADCRTLGVSGESCRLRYAGTSSSDEGQSSNLYRRDLLWQVEYSMTNRAQLPTQLFGTTATNTIPTTI